MWPPGARFPEQERGRAVDRHLQPCPHGAAPDLHDGRHRRGVHEHAVGAYLQDQIKFSEEWHLLASARVDRFDQHQLSRLNGQVLQRTDDTFSPRLGLVYRPLPQLSFYGTASRSYQPTGSSFFFSQNLADLRPERTDLIEVGAKTDWFDGRLQGSLALYRVDKANVATNDPARPNVRLAVGEQRHQGVEVDLVAKPLDGWDVRAAYTYIDAEITKSNNFPVGARPANVPRHAAQVWTNYEIGAGFGIGGGLTYVGARYATADDTVRLPGYVRTDARLYYKHPRFEANLSVNNLFNARYFEAASTNSQISPGAPRSIVLSLRVPL
ncbi:TonB-dependent receptor [Chelatococcus sp. SYSU_G07232]|uniref:TonB-dependent receptor n=1 Tax=Chelatococcus albus TaxID=3047466 RepID=A0ABT7AL33_9HYPH|nr:TonB-dependent receptor [Chelatococcus sp. SYSU_G07232]MDJ1160093.1 TonB-dependent receptor [Chelatococcus sp. SYSU_G07232]